MATNTRNADAKIRAQLYATNILQHAVVYFICQNASMTAILATSGSSRKSASVVRNDHHRNGERKKHIITVNFIAHTLNRILTL